VLAPPLAPPQALTISTASPATVRARLRSGFIPHTVLLLQTVLKVGCWGIPQPVSVPAQELRGAAQQQVGVVVQSGHVAAAAQNDLLDLTSLCLRAQSTLEQGGRG